MSYQTSPVVAFLQGTGRDGRGRTLRQVFGLTVDQLENKHDYIQWIFPLTEASAAVPNSPVLAAADVMTLRQSPDAQTSLARAEHMMRHFWLDNNHWLSPYDHNLLRITRAVKSLRLLADDRRADALRGDILESVQRRGLVVPARTLEFWRNA